MSNTIDKSNFIFYKDEPIENSILGIKDNRIVEIPNFVNPEDAKNMINYFEAKAEMWGDIAFYGSKGKGLLPDAEFMAKYNLPANFWQDIKNKFQQAVEMVF